MRTAIIVAGLAACMEARWLYETSWISAYSDDEDCWTGQAQPCNPLIISKNYNLRKVWECWRNAPSKCWYQHSMTLNGLADYAAICYTDANEWVVELSGYKPSFSVPGHSTNPDDLYLALNGDNPFTCEIYLSNGTLTGQNDMGTRYSKCQIQPVNQDVIMPIWHYPWVQNMDFMTIVDNEVDYMFWTSGAAVFLGFTEECGKGLFEMEFYRTTTVQRFFYGARGQYESSSTRAPTTTVPVTTTTEEVTTWTGWDPLRYCKENIAPLPQFSEDYCKQLCDYHYSGAGEMFCRTQMGTNEAFLACVIAANSKICYDGTASDSLLDAIEKTVVASPEAMAKCQTKVVGNDSDMTPFCQSQCDYFGTEGGSKWCVGSNPTWEQLVDCVATLHETLCSANTQHY